MGMLRFINSNLIGLPIFEIENEAAWDFEEDKFLEHCLHGEINFTESRKGNNLTLTSTGGRFTLKANVYKGTMDLFIDGVNVEINRWDVIINNYTQSLLPFIK
jgi:hypothetical protein